MNTVPSIIDWAFAGRGLEHPSGDLHVVAAFDDGALVALIDGLGHGCEAAVAAKTAAALLEAAPEQPVHELLQRCHLGLRKTRGAVMTLASLDARTGRMTWAGVGNVDGVLLHPGRSSWQAAAAIASPGGIVGYQLPGLRVAAMPVAPGDMLILATDGIRAGFTEGLDIDVPPAETARSILSRFGKRSDDAHVVVARYRGRVP